MLWAQCVLCEAHLIDLLSSGAELQDAGQDPFMLFGVGTPLPAIQFQDLQLLL